MKAPRTPSPKRSREVVVSGDSPWGSSARSTISELSYPDTTVSTTTAKSNRRSPLTVALVWVFCAGLFFFTTESIRYASKVVNYGNINVNLFEEGVSRVTTATSSLAVGEEKTSTSMAETTKNELIQRKLENAISVSGEQKKPSASSTTRGSRSTPLSLEKIGKEVRRKLKMGSRKRRRGRGRGGQRGRNAPLNDLIYLNGGFRQEPASNAQTRDVITRVRTNINVFQPGVGFLPQGSPFILAPGPRIMGMRGSKGMGGSRSMMGMGMGRSGSKGRSRSGRRTFHPTFQPSSNPTRAPSSAPSLDNVSEAPSSQPSMLPSQNPSLQPSVSERPSSGPSNNPSMQPSLSNAPSA